MTLRNRITEFRNERGLTVEELAARADLSPSFVSLLARGKRNISLRNLEKLATALDCRPEDLIGVQAPINSEIADIWAAIPPERRELARTVLQSFTTSPIDTAHPSGEHDTGTAGKKRQNRNLK
jgi:transcriptional regulator with XRE-family HTH domain